MVVWLLTHQQPEDTAISVQDRNTVKAQIVPAMIALSSRPPLQAQLGEAVAIIAEHDFPANWDGLIDVRSVLAINTT